MEEQEQVIARVVLHNARTWSVAERGRVAQWLRETAGLLVRQGDDLTGRYTGRFWRVEGPTGPGITGP